MAWVAVPRRGKASRCWVTSTCIFLEVLMIGNTLRCAIARCYRTHARKDPLSLRSCRALLTLLSLHAFGINIFDDATMWGIAPPVDI